MLLKTIVWDQFILNDDLLESATRWDSILEPHKHVAVEGFRQKFCYGDPQYLEPLGSSGAFALASKHYQKSEFLVTEKVDGLNMAIIYVFLHGSDLDPRSYVRTRKEIIGSRQDRCVQDEQGFFTQIVEPYWHHYETLAEILRRENCPSSASIVVLYGEYYGPKIQKKGKLYGDKKQFRLFGAKVLPPSFFQLLVDTPREEHHTRRWMHTLSQRIFLINADSCKVPRVPMIGRVKGDQVDTPEKIRAYLSSITASVVATEDKGSPEEAFEGVVLRAENPVRQWKLKRRDYGLLI